MGELKLPCSHGYIELKERAIDLMPEGMKLILLLGVHSIPTSESIADVYSPVW